MPSGSWTTGGDIHLVDAILDTFPLSRPVPNARQQINLAQFADSEASPILRRTVRPKRFVARSVELIPKDMRLTCLGSEKDRTENPQVALVPGADTVSLHYGVSDQFIFGFG